MCEHVQRLKCRINPRNLRSLVCVCCLDMKVTPDEKESMQKYLIYFTLVYSDLRSLAIKNGKVFCVAH